MEAAVSAAAPVKREGADKMRKKRYLPMLAASLALAGLMGGCGDTGLMPAGREEEKTESKTADLDWYINFSWFTTTWGKSEVSKAVTDLTGVNVHFLSPKGDESEKLNAMIAADTLPDLVTLEWSAAQNSEMIKNGQVYALNELADQYDPGFYDVLDQDVLDWYKQSDGNLYAYYNSFYTPQDYEENEEIPSNQVFLVRKDIYEALGEPDMTTPEGFSEAVKRAAELFPEVNGEPLIPIGADEFTDRGNVSFGLYLQSFLAVPYEKDGIYYDRNTDPDYLAWLKTFRELAGEGYLKDEIFVDKRLQLKEKFEKGQYFCLLYQSTDIIDQQRKLGETNPAEGGGGLLYALLSGGRGAGADAGGCVGRAVLRRVPPAGPHRRRRLVSGTAGAAGPAHAGLAPVRRHHRAALCGAGRGQCQGAMCGRHQRHLRRTAHRPHRCAPGPALPGGKGAGRPGVGERLDTGISCKAERPDILPVRDGK